MISIPFWNSFFYFKISVGRHSCTHPFADKGQIGNYAYGLVFNLINAFIMNTCYIEIYKFFKHSKKKARENANSTIETANSKKKENNEEHRILWTTIRIVGWTLIGIILMLIL
jgi:hypothetical protein